MILNVCIFALGLVIGFMFTKTVTRPTSVGSLLVKNDFDGPYLFLELTSTPYEVMKKHYVTLKVDITKLNSQK